MANSIRVFFSNSKGFDEYELSAFVNNKAQVVIKIETDDAEPPYSKTYMPLDVYTAKAFVEELNRVIKSAESK
jgi:hypothetical protein